MAQAADLANRLVALAAILLSDLRLVLLCHVAADLSERNTRPATRPKRSHAMAGEWAGTRVQSRDHAENSGGDASWHPSVFRWDGSHSLRSAHATPRSGH